MYVDPAESTLWCPYYGRRAVLLGCLGCARYPCGSIGRDALDKIGVSLFVEVDKETSRFIAKRCSMYIFKKVDSSIVYAPAGFDPDNPDFVMLKDVDEVLCISKVLVKQIRLVAKPVEVRAKIRAEQSAVHQEDDAETSMGGVTQVRRSKKRGHNLL